jgi:hypothetical protein
MRKTIQLALLLLFVTFAANMASAQTSSVQNPSTPTPGPLKSYKADFVVKELDASGHTTNSRSYSTILLTDNLGAIKQIRSGDRVPISVGSDEKGESKFQYIDIGVSIDCRYVHEVDQKLAMTVTVEISSVPGTKQIDSVAEPLIRQFKWNADVLITPGAPATIFSSDDVSSKGKMQVEITATPMK